MPRLPTKHALYDYSGGQALPAALVRRLFRPLPPFGQRSILAQLFPCRRLRRSSAFRRSLPLHRVRGPLYM